MRKSQDTAAGRADDTLRAVVWEFDWSSNSFLSVSKGAERFSGHPLEEWLTPGFWIEHVHPDDAGWAADFCMTTTERGEDHQFEYRFLRADGTYMWVRDIVAVDASARMEGLLRGVLIDISAEKDLVTSREKLKSEVSRNAAEASMRAMEAEAAFRHLADAYFRVDSKGRVLAWSISNPGVARDAEADLTGTLLIDALPNESKLAVERAIEDAIESECPSLIEYRLLLGNRETEWETRCIPIGDEIIVTFRDFTARAMRRRALRESEQRYRALVDFAPYATIVVDRTGVIVFANPAALALLEADVPEQLIGQRANAFRSPMGQGNSWTDEILEHLGSERPGDGHQPLHVSQRGEIVTLKGNLIQVDRAAIEMTFYGEPALMAMVRDVTAEVDAERASEMARDFLERLLGMIDSGVILVGERDHIIRLANRPAEMIFGYEPNTMAGVAFSALNVDEETTLLFAENVVNSLAPGETHTAELSMRRFDGQLFDAEMNIRRLSSGSGQVMATIRDISDRKSAERKLKESELRFRQVVNEAPIGMLQFNAGEEGDLVLVNANPSALGILGRSLSDLTGERLPETIPIAREVGPRQQAIAQPDYPAHGGKEVIEYTTPDGDTRMLEATAFESAPGQMTMMFEDISERIAAARSEARHKSRLSALAAELAEMQDKERRQLAEELHDRVSQALAVSRMQMRQALTEDSDGVYEVIRSAVELLDEAIRETRAITTELFPPVLYELGLPAAVRWVCEELDHTYGLHCATDIKDLTLPLSDEAKAILFRGTRELLMNAVKHGGVKEARVSLRESDNEVVLSVEDDGRGFSADDAEATEGGFGLFSLQQRLDSVGGSLEMLSSPGCGTKVTIRVHQEREQ